DLTLKTESSEDAKVALTVLVTVFTNCLKLLHPFIPFVTEEIWRKFPRKYDDPLIISKWPEAV
ncbi:MAG: class I tRNA ligase family protein, partial [Candidatus Cloacimonetes bacterium]|nr:class I tRNA ligase family protein [Candidatus Cloacimonadota bacterium]